MVTRPEKYKGAQLPTTYLAKTNVNSFTSKTTLPLTYALPVIFAMPNLSLKESNSISMIKVSPGITGFFQRTPSMPAKKKMAGSASAGRSPTHEATT
mmetsp:Transcript_91702/g.159026  ORF Transcript_91702/g.159026 Transcript_91702/m.159026 type:complete len:97 (-) Transcript_91702:708-998(-)